MQTELELALYQCWYVYNKAGEEERLGHNLLIWRGKFIELRGSSYIVCLAVCLWLARNGAVAVPKELYGCSYAERLNK